MKHEIRIPTILALFILIVGLGSLFFLMENVWSFFSWSASPTTPKNVNISNITDSTLTVSWQTDKPIAGAVTYREKGLFTPQFLALDNRDTAGVSHDYQLHFVTLRGLKSATDYEIEIISGKTKQTLTVATGPKLKTPDVASIPVYGMLSFNQLFTKEILVIGNLAGSQTLSALVGKDGSWVLPLSGIRTQDLTRFQQMTPHDVLTLNFISPQKTSTVVTQVDNARPLPTINFGNNYDFTAEVAANSRMIIAADTYLKQNIALVNQLFTVSLPKAGSHIPSYRPEFKGTGIAGKSVYITLKNGSVLNHGQTQVDNSGNWRFSPKTDLPAGRTLAVITSYDHNGNPIAKSVSFNILKSGTSVLGEATPSASLNPSPTTSPLASISPSPTPRASVSPLLTPTPLASATASAITIPISGNVEATWGIILLGLAFLILGGVVVFSKV